MPTPPEELHTYRFGEFTLDTSRGALLKGDEEIRLRPQSFEVLQILVSRHGQLVTRDELYAQVWGNKIVTDDSLAHCMIDIRKAIGDTNRTVVRTVPRRGFKFEGDVVSGNMAPPQSIGRGRRNPAIGVATLGAVLVLALVFWRFDGGHEDSAITGNSIAVLPFTDLSETQDQQYLGDGLSDEILSLLSRTPELRVIARTSTVSFAGTNPDIAAIREALDVAFVLEGSVQRSGNQLKVTARLIDTADSSNVWSESFDQKPDELLFVQKSIAEAVLARLAPDAAKNLATPARRNFSADELMLLARYYEQEVREQQEVDREVLQQAISLYRDATLADPDSALAHSRLAAALLYGGDVDAAEAPIFRALTLDPNLSAVQETLGRFYWYRGLPGAGAAWMRATELNPSNADAWASYAFWTWMQGNAADPEIMYRRALELDPLSLARHAALGEFLAHIARHEETREVIETIKRRFGGPDAYRVIARLLELTGKIDESIAWTIRARDMEPSNQDHNDALAELYAEIGDFETAMRLDDGDSIGLLYKMRRYEELVEIAEIRMLDMPDDIELRYLLAFAHIVLGNAEAAIHVLQTTGLPGTVIPVTRQASDIEALVTLIQALDAIGEVDRAREMADWWEQRRHTNNENWWILIYRACPLAVADHDEKALELLERAGNSQRLPWESLIRDMPCFQRFAGNPRYQSMLATVAERRAEQRARLPATLADHGVSL